VKDKYVGMQNFHKKVAQIMAQLNTALKLCNYGGKLFFLQVILGIPRGLIEKENCFNSM
jgi:hypothetical protein